MDGRMIWWMNEWLEEYMMGGWMNNLMGGWKEKLMGRWKESWLDEHYFMIKIKEWLINKNRYLYFLRLKTLKNTVWKDYMTKIDTETMF